MKSPVFAALVLSASLATVASAQVKSVAAANNPSTTQPAHNQPAITIARARTVADDAKPIVDSAAAVNKTPDAELNNHAAGVRFTPRRCGYQLKRRCSSKNRSCCRSCIFERWPQHVEVVDNYKTFRRLAECRRLAPPLLPRRRKFIASVLGMFWTFSFREIPPKTRRCLQCWKTACWNIRSLEIQLSLLE